MSNKKTHLTPESVSSQEQDDEDDGPLIDFLGNEKRFNVAVTRAKSLQIIVGDVAVLQRKACWNAIVKQARDAGYTNDRESCYRRKTIALLFQAATLATGIEIGCTYASHSYRLNFEVFVHYI